MIWIGYAVFLLFLLKAAKAAKDLVTAEVKVLLELKAKFKVESFIKYCFI